MSLTAAFTPTVEVHHARCERIFREAAARSPLNNYMADTSEMTPRPLPFLHFEARPHEIDTRDVQYFFTQDEDGIIPSAMTIRRRQALGVIGVLQTSVAQECRKQKYAASMIHALFSFVSSEASDYEIRALTGLSNMGKERLPGTYARMHRQFPTVRVNYGGLGAITGERPYEIRFPIRSKMKCEIAYLDQA